VVCQMNIAVIHASTYRRRIAINTEVLGSKNICDDYYQSQILPFL
jgi:hypothetical protein